MYVIRVVPKTIRIVLVIKYFRRKVYLLHLKQTLCHLCPPASFSSAAYTDRSHLGHIGASGALNGMVVLFISAKIDIEIIANFKSTLKIIIGI